MRDDRPLLLLATPRSVSTAFDKMMRSRGDHQVLTEPFSFAWYHGPEQRSDRYPVSRPELTFAAVLDDSLERGRRGPLFVKEMAYQLGPLLRPDVLDHFRVTLLTRDPAFAVPSMLRIWPDATDTELGYEALAVALELLDGEAPVIEGERLTADPEPVIARWCAAMAIDHRPEWLRWDAGLPEDWEPWAEWFQGAAMSTGFRATRSPLPALDRASAARIERLRSFHRSVTDRSGPVRG